MKRQLAIFSVMMAGFCTSLFASSTSPGGAVVIELKGGQDNYIALPFPNDELCTCKVAAVGEELIVLSPDTDTLGEAPPEVVFDDNRFYYAEFTTGELAGTRYDILAYSGGTLFLDTQGDDLRSHPAGTIGLDDQLRIVPHWRLGDVFGRDAASLIIEPTLTPALIRDVIFLPENLRIGTDKTPSGYYFHSGVGWRLLGDPATDRADELLPPGMGVIVRRRSVGDIQLITYGTNRHFPFAQYVQGGDGSSGNDSLVSLQFADPVKLDDTQLTEPGNDGIPVFQPSSNDFFLNDILFVYSPDSPTPKMYYYLDGTGWKDADTGDASVGTTVELEPGAAFYIRKAQSSQSSDWVFDQE
ncbi:MAG: TIGR02597 family protein [Opitutaceae bacterium]